MLSISPRSTSERIRSPHGDAHQDHPQRHSVEITIARVERAVLDRGMKVFARIDLWKLGELARDAHVVARRDQVPPDAPCEPVGTGRRALNVPTTARIERSQVGEQPVHRCIEVRRLLGDSLAQLLQLILHDNPISSGSDIESHSTAGERCSVLFAFLLHSKQ
jgi:hypothetical protein